MGEGLIGREDRGAVPATASCPQAISQRLAERPAGGCDLLVGRSGGNLEREVEGTVLREEDKQVVEHGQARDHVGLAGAVRRHTYANPAVAPGLLAPGGHFLEGAYRRPPSRPWPARDEADLWLGNPVEYPAAHLQPEGSKGRGGRGLSVAASDMAGRRAGFSNTGSWISLAAPGESVFGAVSSASSPSAYPRVPLPGSTAGLYGFASGTSFAVPQVAGAAALVWAANPALSATEVAEILKETASGHGTWNSELGFGVIDVASAVAKAQGGDVDGSGLRLKGVRTGRLVHLTWEGEAAASYRLFIRENGGPERVLLASTPKTSASYSLLAGHVYTFRVAAIDASGAATVASAPFTVSLVRAPASISLRASRTEGVGPLRVDFTAILRSRLPGVSTDSRVVVLESFDGKRWRRAGRATTGASGQASWSFTLSAGAYRVRARFAGAQDLARATSAPVALRVR